MRSIKGFFQAIYYSFLFKLVDSFEFTAPNYNHETQLSVFTSYERERSEKFLSLDVGMLDSDWKKVSQKLIPGRKYGIKIFDITRPARFKDCLEFLIWKRAILVGAQGLSLILQFKENKLPIYKWILSLDIEEALLKDENNISVIPFSCCYDYNNESKIFAYLRSNAVFKNGYCLLCVHDLSAKA